MPRSYESITTRIGLLVLLLCLIVLPRLVQARTWVQVVDTTVYEAALHDPYRGTITFESTQQLLPSKEDAQPTVRPSLAPLALIIGTFPSDIPTPSPSVLPSSRSFCVQANQVLYEVNMKDSWGDGWSGTTLSITTAEIQSVFSTRGKASIFNGTLADGTDIEAHVCLTPDVCYHVFAGGGKWEDEVIWSIREAFDEEASDSASAPMTLVKGNAPMTCQFSIPGLDGKTIDCPYWCSTPSPAPSDVPSDIPTIRMSDIPSDMPTSGASTLVPSLTAGDNGGQNATRSPSFMTKVGSTPLPSSIVPSLAIPQDTSNEVRKPTFSPTLTATVTSDQPSPVPTAITTSEPTGGDAILELPLTPTVAPTRGDVKLQYLPTPTPTHLFSAHVSSADWIWPSTEAPSILPKSAPQTGTPVTVTTQATMTETPTEILPTPTDTAVPSKPPRINEVSIAIESSRPSKSPSLSQSSHFFLRLQQNLATLKKKEEEETLASDYPSGAPSPRTFFT